MSRRRKEKRPVVPPQVTLKIESLDLEAQGVAHEESGRVVFVEGALPGETVVAEITRSKASYARARTVAVLRDSALRVKPRCKHFGVCGGCSMQHVEHSAQVAIKQRVLEDQLWHIGRAKPQQMLRPLEGAPWGYRYRARLSVKVVEKKGGALVGFHERGAPYVADMTSCEVLPPHVSALLVPLRALVDGFTQPNRHAQIELAVGEVCTALVLRHLEPLAEADLALLREFESAHRVQWWLQPAGPDSIARLDGAPSDLYYTLPEFGVSLPFAPVDFTQVNHHINRVLVERAVRLLKLEPQHHVLDWFCGLGNFTLALAMRAEQVLGIEGATSLVQRAAANAERNGLGEKARFDVANLFEIDADDVERWSASVGYAQRWLIDPPREGAHALCNALRALAVRDSRALPERIVYVSCSPATLARDTQILVHEAGYRLLEAGVVNMFPHTSHIESIAVFERADKSSIDGV